MSPQWQRLRGGTSGAAEKVDARPNRGAVRRYFWERSVSFVHSANPTAAEAGGGGLQRRASLTSYWPLKWPVMFPSVTFEGILMTVVLLSPAVPPKIQLR